MSRCDHPAPAGQKIGFSVRESSKWGREERKKLENIGCPPGKWGAKDSRKKRKRVKYACWCKGRRTSAFGDKGGAISSKIKGPRNGHASKSSSSRRNSLIAEVKRVEHGLLSNKEGRK